MQPYPDRPSGSDFELRDLLDILRRQAIPIVIVIAIVLTAFAVQTYRKTDVYEASVTILVDFDALAVGSASGSQAEATRTLQNEIVLLQGSEVKEAAAEAAGRPLTVQAAAGESSDIIVLAGRSSDPEEAADTVNTYAAAYMGSRESEIIEDLEQQLAEVEAQVAGIQTELDENADQLESLYGQRALLPSNDPSYAELSQQITAGESTRSTRTAARDNLLFDASELSIAIDQSREAGGLELLGEAEAPTDPASPDHRKDLLVGLAAALVLAAAVAFVREQLDDSIRTKEELERQSRLPVLGVIPRVASWKDAEDTHLETRRSPRSAAAEAYRTLLTSLEFIGLEKTARVIQVTSPSPGEGKTTTAANLAVAYADAGRRTLVVCCDLRRPRLHRFFGGSPDPGFTSVLLGQADLDEAIVPAPGTMGLWLLPAGPTPANPAELLRGTRSQDLLRSLRKDYDVVIIDSPPILPVADALVLSRSADATLVVATSHLTTRRRLRRALEGLRQVEAPLVGAVLNGVPSSDDYGYDVGYYGYRDEAQDVAPNGATDRPASERPPADLTQE
jgi:capsular exopolysaccharide synthesis family protein